MSAFPCVIGLQSRYRQPYGGGRMTRDQGAWDAIVIGSGIGGLACAAALARTNHAVLVVEQHSVAGGLTQTFQRNAFRWDVGVHYIGEMGPEGDTHDIVDWLADGAIKFASLGTVYDTIHFPDHVELQFARPQAAMQLELKERFPASTKDIDAFSIAVAEADRAGRAIFAERAMPKALAKIHRLWHRRAIEGQGQRRADAGRVEPARCPGALTADQRGSHAGGVPRRWRAPAGLDHRARLLADPCAASRRHDMVCGGGDPEAFDADGDVRGRRPRRLHRAADGGPLGFAEPARARTGAAVRPAAGLSTCARACPISLPSRRET